MTDNLPAIYIVDDDASVRNALTLLLVSAGYNVETFASAEEFLDCKSDAWVPACLILDIKMQGLNGLELQSKIASREYCMPIIFISGHSTVPMSVQAMKLGAVNFLCKPFDDIELLEAVKEALKQIEKTATRIHSRQRFNSLTVREYEVMRHLISGAQNKQIANELDISERTVKAHRKQILKKLSISSIAELVRLTENTGISPAAATT
jgi:FixJ family two-component response regulator